MGNTGKLIYANLQKVVNGLPVAEFKANVIGDPNYIAPVTDLVSCPVNSSLTCPSLFARSIDVNGDTNFEVSIPSEVLANTAVKKIRVTNNTGTGSIDFTLPLVGNGNYLSWKFIGSGYSQVHVRYLDVSNNELSSCLIYNLE